MFAPQDKNGVARHCIIKSLMSLSQATNAFDLLGQATKPVAPVRLATGDCPNLEIAWGSFHQGVGSSLAVLFRSFFGPKSRVIDGFFKDSWVERRIPRRALVAAALWHFFFLVMPSPQLPAAPTHYSAFDNTELTWSGPVNDLPLLDMKAAKAKPSPRGEPEKPLPSEGADAFHPRQRIFTNPVHPTHPRQTLINSAAPLEPPKILPDLPNIVQLQRLSGPARPRLQISQEALARLRPREPRTVIVTPTPLPDVASLEQKQGEISLPVSPDAPARPKLELNAGAAPLVARRAESGDAGAAPDVGVAQASTLGANPSTLIAISAMPGPVAPVVPPPPGNLSARVSISPEGKNPGVPGGWPDGIPSTNVGTGGVPEGRGGTGTGSGGGKNALEVSISGGRPLASNGVSSLGASPKPSAAPHRLITKPDPHTIVDDPPERTGPPNFAALPPNAQPEQVFASRKVYKLLVNMPNLNSATGSWILNFSELRMDGYGPRPTLSDISGPVPIRKVDPKYPPVLINDRVEGEVVLYAVIRRDGSVDSIQLVRGIDEQLDANAMNALGQWQFRPATKQGVPVELEAIVHIPFRLPSNR